ncbi:MAG: Zn-ribbon domain-containing OB-fold protein [Proteobacteria bacterium]|jgi:uncharacterized protein|nr:Zn-ribbon domain-containing OB-fold protein [Pseudomonadota bacterium]
MPSASAWREYPQRYRYEAGVCEKCGKWHFPPRVICDDCGGREFTTKAMQRTGKVLTYTIIQVPPAPFKDLAPYAVAIIEMDDGPRITCQIVDYGDEVVIGSPVRLEFRKIFEEGEAGLIQYGYKAVPI